MSGSLSPSILPASRRASSPRSPRGILSSFLFVSLVRLRVSSGAVPPAPPAPPPPIPLDVPVSAVNEPPPIPTPSSSSNSQQSSYADPHYWEERYQQRGNETYNWLQEYETVRPLLQKYFYKREKMQLVVDLGCGSSDAAKKMFQDQELFPHTSLTVVGVDRSSHAIRKQVRELFLDESISSAALTQEETTMLVEKADTQLIQAVAQYSARNASGLIPPPEKSLSNSIFGVPRKLHFAIGDALNLQPLLEQISRKVDFVLLKATTDAVFSGGEEAGHRLASEIYERLDDEFGLAVVVSYGTVATRRALWTRVPWVRVHACEVGDWRVHRAFILMKGRVYGSVDAAAQWTLGEKMTLDGVCEDMLATHTTVDGTGEVIAGSAVGVAARVEETTRQDL